MKRDFEREFKELKLNEVPDLWNRIEAGLSDKKIAAFGSDAAAISVNRYNFGKGAVWRKWGTLAAACVCVALIIPAISLVIGNLGGRKSDYSGASFSPADNGMDNMGDSAPNMTLASESLADEGMAGAAEAAEYEGMAGAAETAKSEDMTDGAESALNRDMAAEAPSNRDMAANKNMMLASDMAADEDMTSASDTAASEDEVDAESEAMADAETADTDNDTNMTQSSESKGSLDETIIAGLKNGQVLAGVVIEITEASISGEEVVYSTVVKQSDEDGLLKVGAGLSIVCDSDTRYDFIHKAGEKKVLKVGESYEASLRYENNSDSQTTGTYADARFIVVSAKKN